MLPSSRSFSVLGSIFAAAAASAQVNISPLFAAGDDAPGFPAGAVVSDYFWGRQLVGPAGEFALRGIASGGGVTAADDEAVWHISPAGVANLIIREGDSAPGLAGVFIGRISTTLRPGSDGSALVITDLTGAVTTENDSALWRCRVGAAPVLVTREGDPAPGLPSGTLLPPIRAMFAFNDTEAVLSYSSTYLYVTSPAGLVPVALATTEAPETGGAAFASLGSFSCEDGGGRLGFVGRLTGGGSDATNDTGLWTYTPGSGTHLLVREGAAAPELAGLTIGELGSAGPLIGGGGSAILCPVAGPGVTSDNDSAVYRIGGAGLSLVFREGDGAPTAPAFPIGVPIAAEPGGASVFSTAGLVGADPAADFAVLRYEGAAGTVVAREGDAAPNLPGLTLASFAAFDLGAPVRSNNAGRFVLPATVAGPGVDSTNARIILASDVLGGLRLLVRNGETLPLPDGSQAAATGLLTGDINDAGAIGFVAGFEDGKCLYRATVGCPQSGCEGVDLDGNCQIGISDLTLLLSSFGSTGTGLVGDVDGDGDVDIQDLANLLGAFGNTCD